MNIKESFNIFQWVEKLKSESALSVGITAVVLLIFSSTYPNLFSNIRFLVFAIGVFVFSLFLVRLTFRSINKLRKRMKRKSILDNAEVVAVLIEINSQANEISQETSLRGLDIPVDIYHIAATLQMPVDKVRFYIKNLISIGFILGYVPDEVYNTSSDGKEYLVKNNLLS